MRVEMLSIRPHVFSAALRVPEMAGCARTGRLITGGGRGGTRGAGRAQGLIPVGIRDRRAAPDENVPVRIDGEVAKSPAMSTSGRAGTAHPGIAASTAAASLARRPQAA